MPNEALTRALTTNAAKVSPQRPVEPDPDRESLLEALAAEYQQTSGHPDDEFPLQGLRPYSRKFVIRQIDTVFGRPFRRYPTRGATRASFRRHYDDLFNLTHFTNHGSADWRTILDKLLLWTPKPQLWHSRAIKVVLSESMTEKFRQHNVGEEPWEIHQRTGCVIEISESEGNQACLILSGEEESLRRGLDELVRLYGHVTVSKRSPTPDEEYVGPRPSQTHPTELLRVKRRFLPTPISEKISSFPKPREWTQNTLERYVGFIISAKPDPRAIALYKVDGQVHQYVVADLLKQIFSDPSLERFLTPSAFKLALSYTEQRGIIFRPLARYLFHRMNSLQMPLETEMFNILLEGCAKISDLAGFNHVLTLMYSRGCRPDFVSWLMFIRMIRSPEGKRVVVRAIQEQGLVRHLNDLTSIAAEVIEYDLEEAVRMNRTLQQFDLGEFIAAQDRAYGDPLWLSLEPCKRMVNVLCRFGRFQDCLEVIRHMQSVSAKRTPNVALYNLILLNLYSQASRGTSLYPNLAVNILEGMEQVQLGHPRFYEMWATLGHVVHRGRGVRKKLHFCAPDRRTYMVLFDLGVKLWLPNFAAAVWRYACLNGMAPSNMSYKVASHLIYGKFTKRGHMPSALKAYTRNIFQDSIMRSVLTRVHATQAQAEEAQDAQARAQQLRGKDMNATSTIRDSMHSGGSSGSVHKSRKSSAKGRGGKKTVRYLGATLANTYWNEFKEWRTRVPLSAALKMALKRDRIVHNILDTLNAKRGWRVRRKSNIPRRTLWSPGKFLPPSLALILHWKGDPRQTRVWGSATIGSETLLWDRVTLPKEKGVVPMGSAHRRKKAIYRKVLGSHVQCGTKPGSEPTTETEPSKKGGRKKMPWTRGPMKGFKVRRMRKVKIRGRRKARSSGERKVVRKVWFSDDIWHQPGPGAYRLRNTERRTNRVGVNPDIPLIIKKHFAQNLEVKRKMRKPASKRVRKKNITGFQTVRKVATASAVQQKKRETEEGDASLKKTNSESKREVVSKAKEAAKVKRKKTATELAQRIVIEFNSHPNMRKVDTVGTPTSNNVAQESEPAPAKRVRVATRRWIPHSRLGSGNGQLAKAPEKTKPIIRKYRGRT